MPTNNYPGFGYINRGIDFNYFQKYSVTATTFGGDAIDGYQPSILIPFVTYTVILTNLTAAGTGNTLATSTAVVEYSMNGNKVHGELGSCFQNISLTLENRIISPIWFRIQSGSSGPISVSLQAWAIR